MENQSFENASALNQFGEEVPVFEDGNALIYHEGEFYERDAVPLSRDDDDGEGKKPSAAKNKQKSKKFRPAARQPLALGFEFANKPLGASSSSRFVGDSDSDHEESVPVPAKTAPAAFPSYEGPPLYTINPVIASPSPELPIAATLLNPNAALYVPWSNNDGVTSSTASSGALDAASTKTGVIESRSARAAMCVYVRMFDGRLVAFDVEPRETVRNLKTRIMLKGGVPVEQYFAVRLSTGSKNLLEEGKTLAEYNITHQSYIDVNGRLFSCKKCPTTDHECETPRGSSTDGSHGSRQDATKQRLDSSSVNSRSTDDDEPSGAAGTDFEESQEQEIHRLKDELLKLKMGTESTKKAHQLQMEQLMSERDQLKDELKKLRSGYQSEQHKSSNERKKHAEELESRKAQLAKLQLETKAKDAAHNRLLAEMEELRRQNQALKIEAIEVEKRPCGCNVDTNGLKQRSMAAEVSLLKLKRQVEIQALERAYRDADYIVRQLATIIEKAASEDVQNLIDYQDKWQANLRKLHADIIDVEQAFNDQIDQVASGVPLASLKPVVVPSPPQQPQPPTKPAARSTAAASGSAGGDTTGTTEAGRRQNGTQSAFMPNVASRNGATGASAAPLAAVYPTSRPSTASPNLSNGSRSVTPSKGVQPPPGFAENSHMNPVYNVPFGKENLDQRPGSETSSTGRPTDAFFRPISSPPVPPSAVTNAAASRGPSAEPIASGQTGAANGEKRLTKVEMLINAVMSKLPHVTSEENVIESINGFRQSTPRKTLKGIPWDALVAGVCDFCEKLFPPPKPISMRSAAASARVHAPSVRPGAASVENKPAWSAAAHMPPPQGPHYSSSTTYVDDECIVCMEKLSLMKTHTMECKHIAHELCLQQWFKVHKSCPVCRKLALPPNEYPSLN